jgi:hypothetical protein
MIVPRRRLLKLAAAGIAMPYVRRSRAASFEMIQLGKTAFPGQPIGSVVLNPVGHAATPAFAASSWPGGTWPGAWPGGFQNGIGPWSGLANPCTMNQLATKLGGSISGTTGSPRIIAYLDIDGGGSTNPISDNGIDGGAAAHDVTFVGCRFQSAAVAASYNVECWKSISYNIAFYYCSMTPRRTAGPWISKTTSPAVFDVTQPGSWPSASVGLGLLDLGGGVSPNPGGGSGTYQTPYLSAALDCMALGSNAGTYMIVDHCDMWGSGFAISGTPVYPPALGGSPTPSTTPTQITDNWMHDNRFPGPPAWDGSFTYSGTAGASPTPSTAMVTGSNGHIYFCVVASSLGHDPTTGSTDWLQWQNSGDHGELLGFAQGTDQPPQNWTIQHNTMATLGNTNVFVWAITNWNYVNIKMINNYISGCNNVLDCGAQALGAANTGWLVRDNIFATDLFFAASTIDYATQPLQSQFNQSNGNNNVWRGNKLKAYPGDTWSNFNGHPASFYDGQYVLPGTISVGNNYSPTDWNL